MNAVRSGPIIDLTWWLGWRIHSMRLVNWSWQRQCRLNAVEQPVTAGDRKAAAAPRPTTSDSVAGSGTEGDERDE